jgi:hypothetical protein
MLRIIKTVKILEFKLSNMYSIFISLSSMIEIGSVYGLLIYVTLMNKIYI